MNEDDKEQYKAGYLDNQLELTREGERELLRNLAEKEENKKDLTASAKAKNAEEEKK